MKLTVIKEHDDGSADVSLEDLSPEIVTLLIQTGFITLMGEALEEAKREKRMPALFKGKPDEL